MKVSYNDLLFHSLSTNTKYVAQQGRLEGRNSSQVLPRQEVGVLNYTATFERYLYMAHFNEETM
jgi:hypothetical protein